MSRSSKPALRAISLKMRETWLLSRLSPFTPSELTERNSRPFWMRARSSYSRNNCKVVAVRNSTAPLPAWSILLRRTSSVAPLSSASDRSVTSNTPVPSVATWRHRPPPARSGRAGRSVGFQLARSSVRTIPRSVPMPVVGGNSCRTACVAAPAARPPNRPDSHKRSPCERRKRSTYSKGVGSVQGAFVHDGYSVLCLLQSDSQSDLVR